MDERPPPSLPPPTPPSCAPSTPAPRRVGGAALRVARVAAPVLLAFAAGMAVEGRRAEATPTEAS
ncbi:MAG TPA: hypothetical protein PLR99_33380, partial [Polyangiaceae bacterium]|nr:hypothetical protein [Polyangiaceae bacterium]